MKTLREQIQDLVLHDKGASDSRICQILELVEEAINNLDHYDPTEMEHFSNRELFVRTSDLEKILKEKMPPKEELCSICRERHPNDDRHPCE